MIVSRIKAFDAVIETTNASPSDSVIDVDAVVTSLRELPTLEEDDEGALETLAEKLRSRRPPPTPEPTFHRKTPRPTGAKKRKKKQRVKNYRHK